LWLYCPSLRNILICQSLSCKNLSFHNGLCVCTRMHFSINLYTVWPHSMGAVVLLNGEHVKEYWRLTVLLVHHFKGLLSLVIHQLQVHNI
jgi:hypothetical protein